MHLKNIFISTLIVIGLTSCGETEDDGPISIISATGASVTLDGKYSLCETITAGSRYKSRTYVKNKLVVYDADYTSMDCSENPIANTVRQFKATVSKHYHIQLTPPYWSQTADTSNHTRPAGLKEKEVVTILNFKITEGEGKGSSLARFYVLDDRETHHLYEAIFLTLQTDQKEAQANNSYFLTANP